MTAADFAYLDRRFVAMAHRGGWISPADVPRENTPYAFRRAIELGFRYLEIDVQTTADGRLVVFHDDRLDRVTDGTGPVAGVTWSELRGVKVAGLDEIPLLEDVLDEFRQARFNIDIKEVGAIAPLVDALERTGASDRVCVASFSGARLRAFRKVAPEVATAATPSGVAWDTHAFGLRRWAIDPGAALQVPESYAGAPLPLVRRDVIEHVHATGRVVHVWTINDEAAMHRLLDLGVDGLVSDDITTLKRVLVERGLWEEE